MGRMNQVQRHRKGNGLNRTAGFAGQNQNRSFRILPGPDENDIGLPVVQQGQTPNPAGSLLFPDDWLAQKMNSGSRTAS